jgi:hypothetical protein
MIEKIALDGVFVVLVIIEVGTVTRTDGLGVEIGCIFEGRSD